MTIAVAHLHVEPYLELASDYGAVDIDRVAVAAGRRSEICMVAECLLVAGGFFEKGVALGRTVFGLQPGDCQLRGGETLGKGQFAGYRREKTFAVELYDVARVGLAKAVLHAKQGLPTDQAGEGESEETAQQQGQQ